MIEAAIAVLDLLDGDCDIEETGDLEPSLAGGGWMTIRSELDLEADDADDEPGDAWLEGGGSEADATPRRRARRRQLILGSTID